MIRLCASLVALCALLASPAQAQMFPTPSAESPRVQTLEWQPGEQIVLTALPDTTLTTMLAPGEVILRATLRGDVLWKVNVSNEADSFQVIAPRGANPAYLTVETDSRSYEFQLEVGEGLQAAYLVRLMFEPEPPVDLQSEPAIAPAQIGALDWSYRLKGDRSVRPLSIRDDGNKTVIEYGQDQPLPAVFAEGATGKEEVVTGYMRGDRFVIDRVHQKLIFRIDKKKATARRNKRRDGGP